MGRLGLGLAAIGRPAYITSGRDRGPARRAAAATTCGPARTSCSTARTRSASATSTPPARTGTPSSSSAPGWTTATGPTCSSPASGATRTWGTGGMDADTHEVKPHDLATFERQLAESRALLGDRLRLYQVHSLTPDSPLLTDRPLLDRLAALRDGGVEIGVSTSGPRQGEAIERALELGRRRPAGHLGAGDLEPAGALGRPGPGRRARGRLAGRGQGGRRQRPAGRGRRAGRRCGPSPTRTASARTRWRSARCWPSRGATSCCPARSPPSSSPRNAAASRSTRTSWPSWPSRPRSTGRPVPAAPGLRSSTARSGPRARLPTIWRRGCIGVLSPRRGIWPAARRRRSALAS